MLLKTPRLVLRSFHPDHRDAFAALNADPEVMADLGGPYDRARSDAKFDRYVAAFETRGYSRFALEDSDGRFLGYTGVMPVAGHHSLGAHAEVGWRLTRTAWGHGYAMEAATAALQDAFTRAGLAEVLSYTAPDNIRSQAVMRRLGLARDAARDFVSPDGGWHGLVWVARPA